MLRYARLPGFYFPSWIIFKIFSHLHLALEVNLSHVFITQKFDHESDWNYSANGLLRVCESEEKLVWRGGGWDVKTAAANKKWKQTKINFLLRSKMTRSSWKTRASVVFGTISYFPRVSCAINDFVMTMTRCVHRISHKLKNCWMSPRRDEATKNKESFPSFIRRCCRMGA